jgi:hypothetical protein
VTYIHGSVMLRYARAATHAIFWQSTLPLIGLILLGGAATCVSIRRTKKYLLEKLEHIDAVSIEPTCNSTESRRGSTKSKRRSTRKP